MFNISEKVVLTLICLLNKKVNSSMQTFSFLSCRSSLPEEVKYFEEILCQDGNVACIFPDPPVQCNNPMLFLCLLVLEENRHWLVVELDAKISPKFGFHVRYFMQRINIQALIENLILIS